MGYATDLPMLELSRMPSFVVSLVMAGLPARSRNDLRKSSVG